MEKIDDNKEIFKRYGIKNTKQRNLIFEILKQEKKPLTAEEIFLKSRELDDTLSLSTVYRALNTFVSKEIVVKLALAEDNVSVFELNKINHEHYLLCVKCHKAIEIGHCPLRLYENSLEESTDFDIIGHKLEIYGYCPECRDKK